MELSVLRYLNPFETSFCAVKRFQEMKSGPKKVAVVSFAILGFLFFGIGAVAAFRVATQKLSGTSILTQRKVELVAESTVFAPSPPTMQLEKPVNLALPVTLVPYDLQGISVVKCKLKEGAIALLQSQLEQHDPPLVMGVAKDDGDCFYHSIAQLLNQDVKAIRKMVDSYNKELKASGEPNWIQDAKGQNSGQNYTDFDENVSKNAEESNQAGQLPVWGTNVDCEILATVLGVPIIVHEVAESDIIYLDNQEGSPFEKTEGSLCIDKSNKDGAQIMELTALEQEFAPRSHAGSRVPVSRMPVSRVSVKTVTGPLHLACYRQHFVPCYPKSRE